MFSPSLGSSGRGALRVLRRLPGGRLCGNRSRFLRYVQIFLISVLGCTFLSGCSPLRSGNSAAPNQSPMKSPYSPPQKEESFWQRLFKSNEPDKPPPKDVKEWLKSTKPVLPDGKP